MTDITTNAPLSERSKFFRVLIRRKTVLFGLVVLAIFVTLAIIRTADHTLCAKQTVDREPSQAAGIAMAVRNGRIRP